MWIKEDKDCIYRDQTQDQEKISFLHILISQQLEYMLN